MESRTLASRRDFEAVWRAGMRARRDGIVAAVIPAARGSERVGLIARAGSAVVRNRIKRRLRSGFEDCEFRGMDAVVSGDESVARIPYEDLVGHMKDALAAAAGRASSGPQNRRPGSAGPQNPRAASR